MILSDRLPPDVVEMRKLSKDVGMTYDRLAKETGLSVCTIAHVLTGRCKGKDSIEKVKKHLDTYRTSTPVPVVTCETPPLNGAKEHKDILLPSGDPELDKVPAVVDLLRMLANAATDVHELRARCREAELAYKTILHKAAINGIRIE